MQKIINFISERTKFHVIGDYMKKKTVPQHKYTIWYYFGGITLFLFLIQVGTGILLLLYYRPSADEAFESVIDKANLRDDSIISFFESA